MMSKLAALNAFKKTLLSGVFAAALIAMAGLHPVTASAQGRGPSHTWSIAVWILYADGFIYDQVLASGVSTADMPEILHECASSHWTGSVVQFHCYPIPE